MSDAYTAQGDQTLTSSRATALSISQPAAFTHRPRIFRWEVSANAAADNMLTYQAERGTVDGTFTAVTPTELDTAGDASDMVVGSNHTVEPTYSGAGNVLFDQEVHQRALYTFVANPGFEWVIPGTNDAMVGWGGLHASATPDITVRAYWQE